MSERKKSVQAIKKICALYVNGAVAEGKWFASFGRGHFYLQSRTFRQSWSH